MYLFLFSLQVQELSKDDSNGKEGLIVFLFILKKKLRNSDFLITISSQHNVVYLSNYEFCQIKHVLSLKYQRFTPSGCKYIAIRKSVPVAKTQLLSRTRNEDYPSQTLIFQF